MTQTAFSPATMAGIVLAAGRGNRFGSDKRRARLADGTPMLVRVLELLSPFCGHLFVALRRDDQSHSADLLGRFADQPNLHPIYAARADEGMGGSLAEAAEALIAHERLNQARFDGVLVTLADLPFVEPETLRRLLAAGSSDLITVPCHGDVGNSANWGNPVLFGHAWFDALTGMKGDRGARRLFAENPAVRRVVSVSDPGILRDIDRPGDLRAQ